MIWAALRAIRPSPAVMRALAVIIALAGVFWAGATHNDTKRDNEALKAEAETKDRINETISDGVGVPWRDRLLGGR